MRAYAGIGSREISESEKHQIIEIADTLSSKFIVYSGNANGADIAFQKGSKGKCIIFLPYGKFNINSYNAWNNAIDCFTVGDSPDGIKAANELHPAPHNLDWRSMPMMARNYHQIMGYKSYPIVNFVLCCSNRDNDGKIVGGTGQACRIANREGIPVINIRDENWKTNLNKVINEIIISN